MYRAITLIELLIALAVISITLYFLSPSIYQIQDPILLNNEIDKIKAFIYQVQTQARYHKQRYSVSISQNNTNWCIIAIAKNNSKETACNCLMSNSCRITSQYYLYHPVSHKVELKSNSLYPKVFMNIDGVTGRLETICLGINLNESRRVIQFDSSGVINVAQQNKRTKCR
ncbi:Type II secretory pathway, pseudopilin PulG [Pasteurellaceae bacterium Orientalotternb1]|nr:Type II secretory pathway, pseudopilin PulG [Pasteurellaceae bacterium Orientalotternb1]